MTEPTVEPGVPDADTYRKLRVATGLSAKSAEAAQTGLPNTWYGVIVKHDATTIGMGRIIGDGGPFFQIVDICVLPYFQGRGIGKQIMAALVDELRNRAPTTAYVSLIADGDARYLYEQFGFRPTAPASIGMALKI